VQDVDVNAIGFDPMSTAGTFPYDELNNKGVATGYFLASDNLCHGLIYKPKKR
jgi:hypothetical protein